MRKVFLFLIICGLLVCPPGNDVWAAEQNTAAEPAAESETEIVPVILPTDQVSTEDIILYSSACCVMDVDSGAILYYKNPDDRHYPASITKVLTGLLLIENANLNEMITFSNDCWDGLNYYNDMNIGMLADEQLSVEAALHAILLSSANEVCNGAAVFVSGSIKAFCDMMNERAEALGCTNTHFVNPNGLHDKNHYTSAHDMALIAREAIQNPTFRKITGSYDYTVESTNLRPEGFVLSHKHQMLMYTQYHYNACIGGKTGYTEEAKNTLVTYAEKNGMTLVCVVMENADGHLYPDTITALDYCFDNYESLSSGMDNADAGSLTGLPFKGFDIDTMDYVSDQTGSIVIPKDSSLSGLSPSIRIQADAPSSKNMAPYRSVLQDLGSIVYTRQDGESAGSQPLYGSLASAGTVAAADTSTDSQTASVPGTENAGDSVPTFIQLKEPETVESSRADTPSEETDSAPTVLALFRDKLESSLQAVFPWALSHLYVVIPVLILAFIILTLLIMEICRMIRRSYHRHKYKRLRNERIKKRT